MAEIQAPQVSQNGAASPQDEVSGCKVFAGNLSYSVTDEELRAFFAPVESDIVSAQVILRGTRSAGYGFVNLTTEEAAQKAVDALHKTELQGRPVVVEIARPADQKAKDRNDRKAKRRPGRRGDKAIPGEVTEAEANGAVEKPVEAVIEGQTEKPKKKKKNTRKNKKVGQQAEGETATEAHTQDQADAPVTTEAPAAKKRTPKIRRPRVHRPLGEDPVGEPSKNMLFVANLNFDVDDDALGKIFTDAGVNVVSARVIKRRWGPPKKSKGYGFVDVGSEEEQKKAIAALQGKELDGGRQLAVKIAVNATHEDTHEGTQTPEAAIVAM